MLLGAPAALWWLLLVPLIVLLYMLRARRQVQLVPSTLLWERATRDLVARLPVRRLERSLLLLLQVIAVALVALALARPSLALPGLSGDAVVLVVQAGASMQATDEAPSRLAAAQAAAREVLGRLGARQPAAVVVAGRRPVLAHDFSTDRRALAAAITGLRASDARSATDAAVALARDLRADGRPARVHLFGDRPPAVPDVVWHRVGRGAPNAAITRVALRAVPGGGRLLVRVEAFGREGPPRRLVVSAGGRTIAAREVRPAPGAPVAAVFELPPTEGALVVRLEGRDALAADDRAVLLAGREGLPRVLVVGEPNPPLDAVLAAVPTGGVVRTDRLVPAEWARADLIVLDGLQPLVLPPGAYLLIGTLGENLPAAVEGTARDQVIRSAAATHPVTRLADLRGVRVASGFILRPRAGTVLAEGDVPLAWAYEGQGLRVVALPFLLEQSDLALHPAFPVMVANAVSWLAGPSAIAAGEGPVVAAGAAREATLLDPSGATVRVAAREGLFTLPPLDRVGVWTLRAGAWQRRWVVSTAEAGESDLTVPDPPSAPADAAAPPAHVPLAPWLLAAAAVLVVGEWLLWSRTVPPPAVRRRPR
ncbi:MAG: VWA domain-containing protein [Armatimonadota bacterium]|nr:VWA domain-containing protein [Armatimonadota bacterium]